MKARTQKKIEVTESDKLELKNVKVYKVVHKELKKRVAVTEDNISDFVSQAIIEKLER